MAYDAISGGRRLRRRRCSTFVGALGIGRHSIDHDSIDGDLFGQFRLCAINDVKFETRERGGGPASSAMRFFDENICR